MSKTARARRRANGRGQLGDVLHGADVAALREVLAILVDQIVPVRERPGIYRVEITWTPLGEALRPTIALQRVTGGARFVQPRFRATMKRAVDREVRRRTVVSDGSVESAIHQPDCVITRSHCHLVDTPLGLLGFGVAADLPTKSRPVR